jgi:tRNA-modifying protein YgfZ
MQETEYYTAINRSAFYSYQQPGLLLILGLDRAEFLQRQTTGDVRLLNNKNAVLSVLTSPSARILDVFILLESPIEIGDVAAGGIAAITLPNRGGETARFLKSRIFFNDNVKVEDISRGICQVDVLGPQAGGLLEELTHQAPPEPLESLPAQVSGAPVRLVGLPASLSAGWRIIALSDVLPHIQRQLGELGAVQLSDDTYQILQVESGLPSPSQELTDTFTPLEVGLREAIMDGKGCYTGQEVIARQINYNKIAKQLTGLKLDSLPLLGAEVKASGVHAGKVTSTADSPRYGPLALAVLRRPHNEPRSRLTVLSEGQEIHAEVVRLPFDLDLSSS